LSVSRLIVPSAISSAFSKKIVERGDGRANLFWRPHH